MKTYTMLINKAEAVRNNSPGDFTIPNPNLEAKYIGLKSSLSIKSEGN